MRRSLDVVLCVLLLAGTVAPAYAATGLSGERGGLGLRQPAAATESGASRILRNDFALAAPATGDDLAAYGGLRERTRLGLMTSESYGGLAYSFSDRLAASLELAAMDSTLLTPRRYSLSGQLQAAFATGSGMSLGLSYRVYEPDYATRPGTTLDGASGNGYSLVPVRTPGTGLGPSYQLQLQYQYNPTTTFGFVLGRELETFASGFEAPGVGARQFSFTGQHWLTPSWALSYDVLSSDPSSFRLQGLRLGVRYRF